MNNLTVKGTNYVLKLTPPKTVGYWIPVEGTRIGTYKMPSKFHQWTMGLVFGWKFEIEAESTTTQQLLKG